VPGIVAQAFVERIPVRREPPSARPRAPRPPSRRGRGRMHAGRLRRHPEAGSYPCHRSRGGQRLIHGCA
jgi:hypothetical protein